MGKSDKSSKKSDKTSSTVVDVGFTFNKTSISNKYMRDYYKKNMSEPPRFRKAEYYMTGILEYVFKKLVTISKEYANQEPSGLINMRRNALKYAITYNDDLDNFFHVFLVKNNFDPETDYTKQIPVAEKDFNKLLDKTAGKKTVLSSKANNFLYYLTLKVGNEILRVTRLLLETSSGKTLKASIMKTAVDIIFRESLLAQELNKEITRIQSLVEDLKDDEKNDENYEDEEVPEKKTKNNDKHKLDEDSDIESEDSDFSSSDDDSDEEDEKPKQKGRNKSKSK